jgi:1,4-dihydroxy-2-naphthoate octaprenyltransferase
MLQTSTWLHLRIPFSFFLLPVFLFAVSISPEPVLWRTVLVFFITHFLLYPASNGFNSYYDKDEDSIGGLEKPPPVSRELLFTSLVLDAAALLLGIPLGLPFVAGLFIYGTISKMYSHDAVRLKKYPVVSLLLASGFQGAFTFMVVYQAINNVPVHEVLQPKIIWGAVLTTLLLMGFYPMTQIYQHAEDARRGDLTMSRLLGIRGTFVFTFMMFALAFAAFFYFFYLYYSPHFFWLLMACLAPAIFFFASWYLLTLKQENAADFHRAMRLNLLSATGTNLFFIMLGLLLRTLGS